ncbi:MAG: hypothetical protein V8Q36_06820 [Anaerotignum sp.]
MQTGRLMEETMVDLMYQKHPVRFPVAGTEESVKNTTAEKMQQVYDACYLPQKFWLICAGDVDDHQIMEATALVQEKESTGKIVYCKEPDTIQGTISGNCHGAAPACVSAGFGIGA